MNTNKNSTDEIRQAAYRPGMLARSEDEEELLYWFRLLNPTAKQIELARAQGMTQAMLYERMGRESA